MPESVTAVEYGVLYPDGTQDWKTSSWFGSISEPRHRESFNEQYRLRLQDMGVPGMSVRFLKREVTTTISDTVEIFNNVDVPEEPTPEPTPEPDETIEPEAPEPTPVDPEPTPEEVIEDGTEPGTDPEPERQ